MSKYASRPPDLQSFVALLMKFATDNHQLSNQVEFSVKLLLGTAQFRGIRRKQATLHLARLKTHQVSLNLAHHQDAYLTCYNFYLL